MLTDFEMNQIKARNPDPDVALLVDELKQMQQVVLDYNKQIEAKLDLLEADMLRLEAENQRQLTLKECAFIERDACVGLIAQLSRSQGLNVGVKENNQVVVDLPSGQVAWTFQESEAHLFEQLPAYSGPVEELPIEETYQRVMNPGLAPV